MAEHLRSAAIALERVLTAKWPEHMWVVEVRDPEPQEPQATVVDREGEAHQVAHPAAI